MKIEIDTENMSKDEMKHLANMLASLAGESIVASNDIVSNDNLNNSHSESPVSSGGLFSLFEDSPSQSSSSPVQTSSGSSMNMFDNSSQQQSSVVQTQSLPEESSQSLFSIFSDDTSVPQTETLNELKDADEKKTDSFKLEPY